MKLRKPGITFHCYNLESLGSFWAGGSEKDCLSRIARQQELAHISEKDKVYSVPRSRNPLRFYQIFVI